MAAHQSRQVAIATARAGNVIGGGDWAEARWPVRAAIPTQMPHHLLGWQPRWPLATTVTSTRPDLVELQLQGREFGASLQHRDPFKSLKIAAGGPNLHGLLVGNEQPAEPGTVGLVGSHFAAQGR